MYFAYYACTTKLRFSSWSCGSVLRVLHLCYKAAIFELELRKCTARATTVLQSCDFELELRKCASHIILVLQSCGFSSWSCGSVLRVLHSYHKAAIFELELRKCTSRTIRVLRICDFRTGAAEVYCALHLYYKAAIFELELRNCTSHLYDKAILELKLQKCTARYTCTTKLRFLSWSCESVLRALDMRYTAAAILSCGCESVLRVHLCYKVAVFELELRKCTSRATLVPQSCDFRAGAAEVYFAYYTCTTNLRFLLVY